MYCHPDYFSFDGNLSLIFWPASRLGYQCVWTPVLGLRVESPPVCEALCTKSGTVAAQHPQPLAPHTDAAYRLRRSDCRRSCRASKLRCNSSKGAGLVTSLQAQPVIEPTVRTRQFSARNWARASSQAIHLASDSELASSQRLAFCQNLKRRTPLIASNFIGFMVLGISLRGLPHRC